MGSSLDRFDFEARYSRVGADADLADAFGIPEGTSLLRREYSHRDKRTGALAAWSMSWLPGDLITKNPSISDPANAAWPGGTMHQLYTVGIEVDQVIDHVTATMPTTVDAQTWDLPDGTPLLWVRRISIDITDRVVEVSDAQYPADRTMLTFHTPLTRWDDTE
jgi:GntR family transcriptional regulator